MLSYTVDGGNGQLYQAIITSIEMERWLANYKRNRRTKQQNKLTKQLALDKKGRVRITMLYPPGRPVLSKEQFAIMLHEHFGKAHGDPSEPYEVLLKDDKGNKIEGIASLTWAAYVKPLDKWPPMLKHPELGPAYTCLYMLQSDYSKKQGLCAHCHSDRCQARHKLACRIYRSTHLNRPDQRPSASSRGCTTLGQAASAGPIALAMYNSHY